MHTGVTLQILFFHWGQSLRPKRKGTEEEWKKNGWLTENHCLVRVYLNFFSSHKEYSILLVNSLSISSNLDTLIQLQRLSHLHPEYWRLFYILKIKADATLVFKRIIEFVLRPVNLTWVPRKFVEAIMDTKISEWNVNMSYRGKLSTDLFLFTILLRSFESVNEQMITVVHTCGFSKIF